VYAVRRLLKVAMKKWTDHANVRFEELSESDGRTPDLWIYFGDRSHGDPFHFDGPGGTLAHAFYPLDNSGGLPGDMHFDEAEWFTEGTSAGRNFLWVATHELGHSLGLAHSNVREAVMYPYYGGYRPNFQLQDDDIRGIQSIYGKKRRQPEPTQQPTQQPDVEGCMDSIKAMWVKDANTFTLVDGDGRFFDVDVTTRRMKAVEPYFDETPDAAVTIDGTTLVFSGATYTVHSDAFRTKEGPYRLSNDVDDNGRRSQFNFRLPSYVRSIDGAIRWQRNPRYVYLYYTIIKENKEEKYYRKYDLKKKRFRSRGRPLRVWKQLPDEGVDAAISWEDNTVFVRGGEVFKFDDRRVKVERGYPKPLGEGGFLQCQMEP